MKSNLITLRECRRDTTPAGPTAHGLREITINTDHLLFITDCSVKTILDAKSIVTISAGNRERDIFVVETVEEIKSMINNRELLHG